MSLAIAAYSSSKMSTLGAESLTMYSISEAASR